MIFSPRLVKSRWLKLNNNSLSSFAAPAARRLSIMTSARRLSIIDLDQYDF
jgi:hypothetical protein